jgi:hypothetical protein
MSTVLASVSQNILLVYVAPQSSIMIHTDRRSNIADRDQTRMILSLRFTPDLF